MPSPTRSDTPPQEVRINDAITTRLVTKDQRMYRDSRKKMIEAEERVELIRKMVQKDIATNETYGTVKKHNMKLKNKIGNPNKHTRNLTDEKLRDAKIDSKKAKREERQAEKDLIDKHIEAGINRNKSRWIISRIRKETNKIRKNIKKKNNKKIENLVNKQNKEKTDLRKKNLPSEMIPYSSMRIFNITPGSEEDTHKEVNFDDVEVPTLEVTLDEDETQILKNPPKHAIMEDLTNEDFRTEIEESNAKTRFDGRDDTTVLTTLL